MTRRAYLHVGSPKTGTTFLQQVLWAQRDVARVQGLLLPLTRVTDHYYASLDVREVADEPHRPDEASGAWGRLVEEAKSWGGDVLVSHELFAPATAEQAARAVASLEDTFEVHIVVTARDLVRQIPAEWQQHIKSRDVATLPEFIARLRADEARQSWFWAVQDFAGMLRRWGGTLPASQLHVVTVPPPSSPSAVLWERFASLVGLTPGDFRLDGVRRNESLGAEQAELLRLVNAELGDRLPKPGPYHPVVITLLAHRILSGRPGRRLALGPEDREYAAQLSRGVADDLAAMGVDVVGDLADLVPVERSAEAGSAAASKYGVNGDTLRDEAVAALAGLLDSYNAKTVTSATKRQQLRGRVDAAHAQLAQVRRERSEVRAELRATRSQVTALTRRLTQLERRLADVEAERNRLADEARRPLRRLAAEVRERVPVLSRVRGLYRRTVGFARSRARSDGWGEG
jgi:polyhydroxyalkanoate synthesis regulator phasin